MSGGPSHIDLFDYKPKLAEYHGTELPGFDSDGAADYRDDFRAKVLSLRRPDVQFSQAWSMRGVDE
jgi:hypothetical protein